MSGDVPGWLWFLYTLTMSLVLGAFIRERVIARREHREFMKRMDALGNKKP